MKRFLLIVGIVSTLHSYNAVVRVPIADALGMPAESLNSGFPVEQYYKRLPESPYLFRDGTNSCPRIFQLLFHQPVTVVKETPTEVCCRVPHAFYEANNKKIDTFWTLKSNIVGTDTLANKNQLPQSNSRQTVIALTKPYKDPTTDYTFSAGTRFVVARNNRKEKSYTVHILNPKQDAITQTTIPYAVAINTPVSPSQQRQQFVQLIRDWAHQENGFIPYVWGGCSFTGLLTNPAFKKKDIKLPNGNPQHYYAHLQQQQKRPFAGVDCAGLVFLAAQLVGIHMPYKNTITMANNLTELPVGTMPQAGDLLYFPGHILIVSNPEQGLFIEARDFIHGFGKVQELPLEKLFKGTIAVEDLYTLKKHNKPLERLDSNGNVVQIVPTWKFLKLTA